MRKYEAAIFFDAMLPELEIAPARYGLYCVVKEDDIQKVSGLVTRTLVSTTQDAEAYALLQAVSLARIREFDSCIFRGDNQGVIEAASSIRAGTFEKEPRSYHRFIETAVELAFPYVYDFEWIPREENSMADRLTKPGRVESGILESKNETKAMRTADIVRSRTKLRKKEKKGQRPKCGDCQNFEHPGIPCTDWASQLRRPVRWRKDGKKSG